MLKQYFADRLGELTVQVGSILLDTVMLAVWLAIEFSLEHFVVTKLTVSTPIFSHSFLVARIIFAIATLAPILIYTISDIQIIWSHARERVRAARNATQSALKEGR